MRIGHLRDRTGVPLATIKYYLREGLLPAGRRTGRNQAEYDERHVRRLALIRALVEIGGLRVATVRDILAATEAPDVAIGTVFGDTQGMLATAGAPGAPDPDGVAHARRRLLDALATRGWCIDPDTAPVTEAAHVLATLTALGQDDFTALLDRYVEAAESLATHEVAALAARPDRERMVQGMVIGTVLGERLLVALRRLAHQNATVAQLPTSVGPPGATDRDDTGAQPARADPP